jgi:hypothetical protein
MPFKNRLAPSTEHLRLRLREYQNVILDFHSKILYKEGGLSREKSWQK